MKVTAITCSTGRPESLQLCKFWVARQTLAVDQHVIAQGEGFWSNWKCALSQVEGDVVVVFEDDDFYPSDWVERCVEGLEHAPLFGQSRLLNYHVPTGGYQFVAQLKRGNAPLHATAFHVELVDWLLAMPPTAGKPRVDVALWQHVTNATRTTDLRVISMKGMPGTRGYSAMHDAGMYTCIDEDRSLLRSLIGTADLARYRPFFRGGS